MNKVIIAGSRNFNDYEFLENTLNDIEFEIHEIISGKARGADSLGEQYAKKYGIPIIEFPAEWDKLGRGAGYIRNKQMAEYGNVLIAFWDGKSKGTEHMIQISKKNGLKVIVVEF